MSLRLALVEYLNTFPFSEGIRRTGLDTKLEIHRVTPALCAQLFQERKVDISLCPIGALRDMPDHRICGQYCIGADGAVDTVLLLSQVPIEKIGSVRLDDHSRTSNVLLQILATHFWKMDWKYYFGPGGAEAESCLMIGDKVFKYQNDYAYAYDLALAWKKMTALPMVFAVWIARPDIPENIIQKIDHAFETGMKAVREGMTSLESWQIDYLTNKISYKFDSAKAEALSLFRELSG